MMDTANSANAGLSAKARLAAWRASRSAGQENGAMGVARLPEDRLLRDVVLILQGIDGAHVRFHDSTPKLIRKHGRPIHVLEQDAARTAQPEGGLVFIESDGDAQVYIPQPTRDALHRLSELGWLYRQVHRGIQEKLQDDTAGMIELSLCHCLREELWQYDNLIASLERRRAKPSHPPAIASDGALSTLNDPELGLTLSRIVIWTEPFRLRMRMMGVLISGCAHTRGGALLSLLHSYTTHGDPFIREFTSTLLDKVSEPFFKSLAAWIYEGELVDPNDEFFVEHNAASMYGADGSKVEAWSARYKFRQEMLPTFLNEDFGRKIFSTGRSLNYIKYACGDAAWVTSQRKKVRGQEDDKGKRDLKYSDIAGLERSIDEAYSNASKRLFEIFFDKFGLLQHLRALKDYLLLGRGDFVELLMESLGPSLSRPANTLYRHNLTATLETAIRGSSSANESAEILRRLDARMLEFSHGEIGWDVFTLEYKVDPPVDVVLDSESMLVYTKLFTHLWRIKRCEYVLNDAWKKVMNGARWYTKVVDLHTDFHQSRLVLSEMIHFVRQMQYFCQLEVIDCSWAVLEDFTKRKQGDLDALIDAHQSYVKRLASKALLRGSGSSTDDSILRQVREAFSIILVFKDTVDALCNVALAEASRIESEQDEARGIRGPASASRTSTPLPPLPPADPETLAALRRRLVRYGDQFHETVVGIATSLASHSDLDLRFLSCRINFSLFYLVGRRDKK